ncbi:MAG: tyrosine-type recombinase/integrase [Planctomycetota bacterium]
MQAPPPAATPAPARASLPSGEAVCSREADPSPSPAPAHLSWEDALERYHDHQQARRSSPRTIYSHRREILKLADALRGQVRGPADVTLDQLRRYQLALLKRRLTPATVANASGHLRTFFRFLHLEELLPEDPASRLERPKVPPRPPGEVLTTKEVQLLLQACEGSPTPLLARAVVETFYCTGIRRTELLDLDLTDVDHRQRTLLVRAGKGERPRVLPLAPACYEALSRYLDFGRPELERAPTQALFLSTRGDRLSKDSVARLLYELSDRAGLGRRATPHCFRRTCATGLLNNGTSLKVIQAILGHRSLETTSVYLCLSPEEIREAVLTHHPRERFEA